MSVFRRETRVLEVDRATARAIMRETRVVEVDRASARVVMRETVRDQGATVMEGAKTALTGGHRHDNKAKEWTPSP